MVLRRQAVSFLAVSTLLMAGEMRYSARKNLCVFCERMESRMLRSSRESTKYKYAPVFTGF